MSFLLDTNICSAHMRRPGGLAHRFFQYGGRLNIPSIVLGELYAGAYMMGNPTSLLVLVADLLQIAAVASVHSLTLVTNNIRDFRHIPGLQLEDWLTQ